MTATLPLFFAPVTHFGMDVSTVHHALPLDGSQVGCSTHGENTPLPEAPCAWCAKEAGIAPLAGGDESHTVCARHYCMTLLQGRNIPVQAIKDRAVRMYGTFEGLAGFDTAVQLLALHPANNANNANNL